MKTVKNILLTVSVIVILFLIGVGLFYESDRSYQVDEPEFTSWIIELKVYGYDVNSHKIIVKETHITDDLHIDELRRTVRFKTERNEYITIGIDSVKIQGTRL